MNDKGDILDMYGSDTSTPHPGTANSGGVTSAKSLAYSQPQGPKGIGDRGPGLHGDNHGCCGTQNG